MLRSVCLCVSEIDPVPLGGEFSASLLMPPILNGKFAMSNIDANAPAPTRHVINIQTVTRSPDLAGARMRNVN